MKQCKGKIMNRALQIERMNELKAELKELEKELHVTEQRWIPRKGERYFFIDEGWDIAEYLCEDDSVDSLNKVFYNCFKTYEAAEAELDRLVGRRCLSEIADRLNQGKTFDWSNPTQKKYYLAYDWQSGEIVQAYAKCSEAQGTVYCLCEDFYDKVMDEIDVDTLLNYVLK